MAKPNELPPMQDEYRKMHIENLAEKGNHPAVRIPDDEVRGIRRTFRTGKYTHQQIADIYGISRQYVCKLVNYQSRVAVGE